MVLDFYLGELLVPFSPVHGHVRWYLAAWLITLTKLLQSSVLSVSCLSDYNLWPMKIE